MNLTEIGQAIDNEDPKKFVKTYLLCMAHGYSLPCPVDQDKLELNKKWSKVLAKYRRDFSDDFCLGVTTVWLRYLTQCKIDEPNLELQLCNAADIKLNSVTSSDDKENAEEPEVSPSLLRPVSSKISHGYRDHQKGQTVNLPKVNELKAARQKAFQAKDPVTFLINHLTFSNYDDPQDVPRASLPDHIRSAWEDIFADLFQSIADDRFLERISNDWFYLVNQKGIPMTAKDQSEILIVYLAKSKSETSPVGKKRKTFLQRLFG